MAIGRISGPWGQISARYLLIWWMMVSSKRNPASGKGFCIAGRRDWRVVVSAQNNGKIARLTSLAAPRSARVGSHQVERGELDVLGTSQPAERAADAEGGMGNRAGSEREQTGIGRDHEKNSHGFNAVEAS